MLRRVIFAVGIMVLVVFAVACASAPTPTIALPTRTRVPTLPPLFTPTVEPPKPTVLPTLPPPTATATLEIVQPTSVISVTQSTSTPTVVATLPPTPTVVTTLPPAPTAVPAFPPGLYVSNMRIEPNPPVRAEDLKFYVTFTNTAGSVYNPRWLVYIFRADTPNRSYSETTALQSSIPSGTLEIKSDGSWKLGPGGPCDYFFARVGFLDVNNKPVMYTSPDGNVFEKGFTVCPR